MALLYTGGVNARARVVPCYYMFIEPELLVLAFSGLAGLTGVVVDRFRLARRIAGLETTLNAIVEERADEEAKPPSKGGPYRESGVVLADDGLKQSSSRKRSSSTRKILPSTTNTTGSGGRVSTSSYAKSARAPRRLARSCTASERTRTTISCLAVQHEGLSRPRHV